MYSILLMFHTFEPVVTLHVRVRLDMIGGTLFSGIARAVCRCDHTYTPP